ncbi:ABC transporter substrate-binding protein [Anaerolentibacter hominis]|uniref:ABC transporter substrate-binding protein n=1 Tax=Anaerolentibacter hominis TaxID=3079009 RepID=UPI0031B83799
MKKKLFALFMAVCMVLTAVGCSSQDTEPVQTDNPGGQNDENAQNEGEDKADYRIVFVPKGVADFWTIVSGGFEQAAKEADINYEVIYPSQEEASVQVDTLYDVINSKPDAIVLSPIDQDALIAPCQEAKAQGIPVILVDTLISSEDYVTAFATDNEVAGAKTADTLAELIGKKGKVHIFAGGPSSTSNTARAKGFTERMEEAYPDVEVLGILYSESDMSLCTSQVIDIVQSNPDLKGIFAIDEVRSAGCANALVQLDRSDIKLCGFDANNDTVALMEDGIIQSLTVQQPYQMGYLGFGAALKAIQGEELERTTNDTGSTVVLREKMQEEEMQKLLFPLDYIE